jgi:hypothetical protein
LTAVVFPYGNGEVRAVKFTEPTADAGVGMFDDRLAGRAFADDALWTKGAADAAGLAPVPKDELGEVLFSLL